MSFKSLSSVCQNVCVFRYLNRLTFLCHMEKNLIKAIGTDGALRGDIPLMTTTLTA